MAKFWIIVYPNDRRFKGTNEYVKTFRCNKDGDINWTPVLTSLPKNAMPYWDEAFAKAELKQLKPIYGKLKPKLLTYESNYLEYRTPDGIGYNFIEFDDWRKAILDEGQAYTRSELIKFAYEKGLEDALK